jgi:ferrous iron transport protein A
MAATTLRLADCPNDVAAVVVRVDRGQSPCDDATLRRLGEIGFIPGEPVRVLRRGPGGREPLAVLVGDTLFALRLAEARCIEVASDV